MGEGFQTWVSSCRACVSKSQFTFAQGLGDGGKVFKPVEGGG